VTVQNEIETPAITSRTTVYLAVDVFPNPGKAGWALVWRDETGNVRELTGVTWKCSNMRAELIAAMTALRELPTRRPITIVAPSQYLLNYETALPGWKRRDWRGSTGKAVKNADEWFELDKLACRRDVKFQHGDDDPHSLAGYARQRARKVRNARS